MRLKRNHNQKRKLVLMLSAAVFVFVFKLPSYAQDNFFDEMMSVSDQDLEKTSEEEPQKAPPAESNPAETEEMQRTIEMLTPMEPMPVTPNIEAPVPPVSSTTPDKKGEEEVEILLEEPPLSDSTLQKTDEEPTANIIQPGLPVEEKKEDALEPVETLSEKAAETKEASEPKPVTQNQAPQGANPPPTEGWSGSIMFTNEEYRVLRQAISFYERKTGKFKSGLAANGEGEGTSSKTASPSFYLGSIAYISKDDWAVWLNNVKYTNDKPNGEVTITAISPDKVQLVWSLDSLDITAPNWRNKLVLTNTGEYVSQDNQVQVNNSGTQVIFILRPNQSFLTSHMGIVEGREEGAL